MAVLVLAKRLDLADRFREEIGLPKKELVYIPSYDAYQRLLGYRNISMFVIHPSKVLPELIDLLEVRNIKLIHINLDALVCPSRKSTISSD